MKKVNLKKILVSSIFVLFLFASNSASAKEEWLLKNWDTVNMALEYYDNKTIDEAMADFGNNYTEGEDECVFFSPSGESSITFSLKKRKIKGFSYQGSYSEIASILNSIPKLKVWEIKAAANNWIGVSPETIKEVFSKSLLPSYEKAIFVGHSLSNASVEFRIASLDSSAPQTGGSPKRYVKSVEVRGTYDALKDCFVCVPMDTVFIKKSKGKNVKDIAKVSAGNIEKTSQKKKFAFFYSDDNSNALQVAIQEGNFVAAEWLAENEICDVNHWNVFGRTAINDAIEAGDTDILKILFEHGAKINTNPYIFNPVVQTVSLGNLEAAQYLKSLGVDYSYTWDGGYNLIHVAALEEQKDIIPFLIQNGCKIDAANSAGVTPLLISIDQDDPGTISALLKNGASIERKNSASQTPIFYAIEKSSNASLQTLIDNKANIEAKDNAGRSPFLFAYEIDNITAAQKLMEAGAAIPRTQLLSALKSKKYSYLPLLIKGGVPLSVIDSQGQNVLHIAAQNSDATSLSLFLETKEGMSIINAKDGKGSTPLILACDAGTGFTNGAQILIDAGASVVEANNNGNTAIHAALLNNRDSSSKELSQMILSKNAELLNRQNRAGQTPLMIALENSKKESSAYLLNQSPNVSLKDYLGNTSLHYACNSGLDAESKKIVFLGGAANAVNSKSETPLTLAARNKNEELVEYFLAMSGIKIDIKDNFGKSARDYIWALYDLRIQESEARRAKLTQERQEAWNAISQAQKGKGDLEVKNRALERENNDLQRKINNAEEGTNTSSWKTKITTNNIAIVANNVAISVFQGTISKMERQANECTKNIDKEFAITKSYINKKEKLNNIPRG